MSDQPSERKTYQLVTAQPQAVVIYCSDPRFQKAFGEFITEELHLHEGEYIPLVISGGVASLAQPLRLPKEFKFVRERIQLFLERFDTIRRIVLINHEDCKHYEALKGLLGNLFLRRSQDMTEKQKTDLRGVARILLGIAAPGLRVESYYARILDPAAGTVTFETIGEM